jgi:hypothetical protein
MSKGITIKRTVGTDPDFRLLISHLDHELWNELKEDQATYDQYNKVPDIRTALVLYINEKPVASGCFKKCKQDTIEIKRMFVEKEFRGKGLAKSVLDELEKWAFESGFKYAVLETSIHFKPARALYNQAGYEIIENYDPYAGLKESVCMRKKLAPADPSEFKDILNIEYFDFEEDFVEKNIRCIPMIVRFKMDKAGIKLKLAEWSRFNVEERIALATKACRDEKEAKFYKYYLAYLIRKYTGKEATWMLIDENPEWSVTDVIPPVLIEKLKGFGWSISIQQWKKLTDLQRFALLKQCKEGHENKNFPKAMKEFNLVNQY